MVLEVMGRHAGWIALYAGIAGGGDILLIPEISFNLKVFFKKLTRVLEKESCLPWSLSLKGSCWMESM